MKKLAGIATSAVFAAAMLGGCGGDSDFCSEAKDILEGSSTAVDPTDPDALQKTADQFGELADNAPDEIKDDFTVMADQLQAVAEGDPEAIAELDPEALTEAGTNIQKWGDENCSS